MARREVTLLMTCAGGAMVPALLRALHASALFDYTVIGTDMCETPGAASAHLGAFHRVPSGETPDYVQRITALADQYGVDVIWPGSDLEALALSGARAELAERGCHVLASPPDCLERLTDKRVVYETLAAAGIAVPEHATATTSGDVWLAMREYGYPARSVAMKPRRGRGGRGLCIMLGDDNPADWLGTGQRERRIPRRGVSVEEIAGLMDGEVLVMPLMQAPAYDVDVLAHRGHVAASVVRRRVNPTGIPFRGNWIVADAAADRYCRTIAEALNLDALHDMDLMTVGGEVRLLEVNPRPSGSVVAALCAGFPIADAAIGSRLGVEVTMPAIERDIEVQVYSEVVAMGPVDAAA